MIDERFYRRLGPLSLKDIVEGLSVATSPQDETLTIHDAASLDESLSGQISYYGGKSHIKQLSAAGATACFTQPENVAAVEETGLVALITKFPRAAFGSAIERLYSKKDMTSGQNAISDSAILGADVKIMPAVVIGAGAQIGDGVSLGPNCVIYPGVVIGEGTVIGANAVIMCAVIGKNCYVQSGAVIGGDGFGIAPSLKGAQALAHVGRVVFEDNVSVGSCTAIDRGMLGDTYIGQNVKIDNLCQIAHNCYIGANTLIAAHAGISGSVTIGKGVIMAGRVGIADHLNIGDGATLAGNSSFMHDVPAGEIWAGYPAKPIRQFMRETAMVARLIKPKKSKS